MQTGLDDQASEARSILVVSPHLLTSTPQSQDPDLIVIEPIVLPQHPLVVRNEAPHNLTIVHRSLQTRDILVDRTMEIVKATQPMS